ncbi:unnamed protein product [Cercospora beticola]|nr:unnamed protein product [Cercospora beticola]
MLESAVLLRKMPEVPKSQRQRSRASSPCGLRAHLDTAPGVRGDESIARSFWSRRASSWVSADNFQGRRKSTARAGVRRGSKDGWLGKQAPAVSSSLVRIEVL